MKNLNLLLCLLLIILFSSCSSDEAIQNDIAPSEAQIQVGRFLDSAVEGLYYETQTQSGFTNQKGEFNYLKGETINFFIGEMKLGKGPAEAIMTPISIAKSPKASIYTPEVQYMAALLQTLDIDGDPSNGIKLDSRVTAVLDELDADILKGRENANQNILEVVKMVKEKTGIELNEVFPEQAASHLAQTLGQNYEVKTSLIPAIKSLNQRLEPMSVFTWELEFTEDNWIRKIIQNEKYPDQIFAEYDFLSFNIDGQPTAYTYKEYNEGSVSYSEGIGINYNDDGTVSGFRKYRINEDQSWGELYQVIKITGIDTNGYVTQANYLDPAGNFKYRYEFKRNQEGEKISMTRYATEEEVEGNFEIKYTITYNAIGDLDTVVQEYQSGFLRTRSFIYRNDNTLKQEVVRNSNNNTVYDYFYDEQEVKLQEFHISQGEWRSEYVEFYPDGSPKLVNTYYQDWLQEIATFDENGSAELQIWDLDKSGSFKIDFRDPDNKLYKIEYYNDEAIYFKTEYYENGELINTEYA